ncbi:serine hydrolase domain-containing protein [Streptomyces sp. NPDC052095]|uniref:serine hydrolase domain-containing protein n=1 Tax=unclassified Streptomyces TaxID=2593676 RepID=UPI00344B4F61
MSTRRWTAVAVVAAILAATAAAAPVASASGPAAVASSGGAAPAGADAAGPRGRTAFPASTTGTWQRDLAGIGRSGPWTSAIARIEDGRRVWTSAAGVSDLARPGQPLDEQGRFRIGSVTKTFVATTVLQLVAEHRLSLDDTVEQHFPGLVPDGDRIVVRQLLNHTSGLFDPSNAPGVLFPDLQTPAEYGEWIRQGGLMRTYTPRQLVRMAVEHPPTERGVFAYSNTNYHLLGMLIEKITGHTYADEITRRVLRPLGMNDTGFPGTSTTIPGPHAHSYIDTGASVPTDVSVMNPSWGGAAGEMISTTEDLLRFHRALLRGRLLPPAQMREMTTTVPTGGDPAGRYGLGLASLRLSCGVTVWGHAGTIIGYKTPVWGTADRQIAFSYTQGTEAEQERQEAGKAALLESAFCPTG